MIEGQRPLYEVVNREPQSMSYPSDTVYHPVFNVVCPSGIGRILNVFRLRVLPRFLPPQPGDAFDSLLFPARDVAVLRVA